MKYRFQYIGKGSPGTICEFDRMDVKEMAKNSHDWRPHPDDLQAIKEILMDDLAPEIKENEAARIKQPLLTLPQKNGDDRADHRK